MRTIQTANANISKDDKIALNMVAAEQRMENQLERVVQLNQNLVDQIAGRKDYSHWTTGAIESLIGELARLSVLVSDIETAKELVELFYEKDNQ